MIHESLMAQGAFDVPLRGDTPWDTLSVVAPFGHVVVTEQWIDPRLIGDANMLAAARYAGPVFGVEWDLDRGSIHGAGMAWWLGDEQAGPMITSKVSLSAANLSTSLTAVLPDAITLGNVSEPGGSFTGQFQWETPLSAVRTICAALNAEWRVNADGTLDAGPANVLFTIDAPTNIVVPQDWGSDPNYQGVPSDHIQSRTDGRGYVTAVNLIQDNLDGTFTTQGNDSRSTSYLDIHGNAFTRTALLTDSVVDSTAITTYLATELAQRTVDTEQHVETSHLHSDAVFTVGDKFLVYAPPVYVDTTNPVYYRGQLIWPTTIRLLDADWPLQTGMGVFYRASDATYTDLSHWIDWEAT